MSERITLHRGDVRDPETGDWAEAGEDVPFDVESLAPQPSSDTDAEGRQGFVTGYTVYAPQPGCRPLTGGLPAPEVRPSDAFTIRGHRYVLDGAVGDFRNPLSSLFDGVQFTVRRGEG